MHIFSGPLSAQQCPVLGQLSFRFSRRSGYRFAGKGLSLNMVAKRRLSVVTATTHSYTSLHRHEESTLLRGLDLSCRLISRHLEPTYSLDRPQLQHDAS